MRVLLFGATGFIGRNILEQLGGKHDIIAPTKEKINIETTRHISGQVDVIINCVNAQDNLSVYQNIVHNYEGKLIHLGSGAVYDHTKPIKNVTEDFERKPTDDYGLDKYYISEQIKWRDNTVCLRPFGVFGKYEDYRRRFISSSILTNMNDGQTIHIFQNKKFSYVWVNDLVRIIDYFIQNKAEHKFYNVGGHQIKLNQIAKKIGKYKVNKWNGNEYTCDDTRVRHESGIIYTPFDESLKELRKFYEKPSGNLL